MSEIIIRKALEGDIKAAQDIIGRGRDFMRSYGNTFQWGETDYPGSKIPADVEKGNGYVAEYEGKPVGYFAFILGNDPTYEYIEGQWLNDEPYGTIHRIASDGSVKGIFEAALKYCLTLSDNVRIDTHDANLPMRHKLDKNGFTYCGTIYIEDGTSRRAYQKKK